MALERVGEPHHAPLAADTADLDRLGTSRHAFSLTSARRSPARQLRGPSSSWRSASGPAALAPGGLAPRRVLVAVERSPVRLRSLPDEPLYLGGELDRPPQRRRLVEDAYLEASRTPAAARRPSGGACCRRGSPPASRPSSAAAAASRPSASRAGSGSESSAGRSPPRPRRASSRIRRGARAAAARLPRTRADRCRDRGRTRARAARRPAAGRAAARAVAFSFQ